MAQRRCTAKSVRSGQRCKKHAIRGGTVCATHGGSAPAVKDAARRNVEAEKAARAVVTFGLSVKVDPHEALLEEVHRTAGHVRWLAQIVADLDHDALVWGVHTEKTGGEDWGTTKKAAPNVWLDLYHRERAHLVKVAKTAIDAGIDERRVQLAEQQGAAIVQVIRATLQELGVDITPEVASTVGRHLRAIDGGKAA